MVKSVVNESPAKESFIIAASPATEIKSHLIPSNTLIAPAPDLASVLNLNEPVAGFASRSTVGPMGITEFAPPTAGFFKEDPTN
jgi:hypothetical protein